MNLKLFSLGKIAKKAENWVIFGKKVHRKYRSGGMKGVLYAGIKYFRPDISGSVDIIMDNIQYDVIFIIGCTSGESKRYRVHNINEGISKLGYEVISFTQAQAAIVYTAKLQAKVVIFFRCAYDQISNDIISYCRKNKINTAFDVDDLVFDPQSVSYIDAFNKMDSVSQSSYLRDVYRYKKMIEQVDYVTVSTHYLALKVKELGKKVFCIPNTLNESQIDLAKELLKEKIKNVEHVVDIIYLSGSNTHQKDFQQCNQALLQIFAKYPQCRLIIVGFLELGSEWEVYSDRITRYPFQPYLQMLKTLAKADINIASLELDNPFCDSKSQLKIFEAGVVGVPTIASATKSYCEAITNGEDGFLASSLDDWYRAFEVLVTQAEARKQMGEKARMRSLKQFDPNVLIKTFLKTHHLVSHLSNELPKLPIGKLSIHWIVPGIIIGSGGHRNIFRAAYFLQRFGHHIELYFTDTDLSAEQIASLLKKHFYPLKCPIHVYKNNINPCDVLFATHWSTVKFAIKAKNKARNIFYFVQDFEPEFYPVSSEYILSENTYRLGLYHITSGPWCEHLLKQKYKAAADFFQFPIDKEIYYPRKRTKENKNIIFFAKPEMPRRCYEIGIACLTRLYQMKPDLEIIVFGSKKLNNLAFPFPVTIKAIVPTINDLAQMYSNGDLGIAFSTTNPSLVPYEMIACGLPVVDIDRGNNEVNYSNSFDIALLANPDPERMAKQISLLLDNSEELENRKQKGLDFVKHFPTELEMAKKVEQLILDRLKDIGYSYADK